MLRLARAAALFGGAVAALACASVRLPDPPELPRQHVAVPFFPQEDLQCGPAALAMALQWTGEDARPEQLSKEVFTPGRDGSLPVDLIGATRRHGHIPYPIDSLDALLGELEAGRPVLVLQNLSFALYPQWHYALAIGYDLTEGTLLMHSGREQDYALALYTFDRTWARSERWARVIPPPGELPAQPDEERTLEAIADAEQAGAWQAARDAYAAAIERWPASARAWLGAGNTRYKGGDLAGSEAALTRATELDPSLGPAWNNLAHVQAEQGKRGAARATIDRALALGGPWRDLYLRTLAEIEAR